MSIGTRFKKNKRDFVYDKHSYTIRLDGEEENSYHPRKPFLLQLFDFTLHAIFQLSLLTKANKVSIKEERQCRMKI